MKVVKDFIFFYSKITVDGTAAMKLKEIKLLLGREAIANIESMLKEQRHHFASKSSYSQSYDFSSSHLCI